MQQLTINPFQSESQQAWMFSNEPNMARRWQRHTKRRKLPKRKHPVTNGRIARLDPSRTITLRRQFQRDLSARFNRLKQAIVKLILHDDALGLKPRPTLVFHAEGRWQFHSTEQKLTAFREWLKRQIILHLVGEHLDEHAWWNRYIMDGFRRGAARAFDDTRPQVKAAMQQEQQAVSDFYRGTKAEFLRSSFNWPVSREKVKLLASRTFTDLKGVTDGMAARISHTLVDGLTKGDNPKVIAKELAKNVNVGKVRSQAIARTEIVRTHAEGQLDAFQRLGVTHVGVMAEWLTAEDSRVCEKCRPLDGIVLKVEEATGLLPRHVNCRCAWTPANVGEDELDQKRSKGNIERAISESYGDENPDKSSWGGADKVISKARPKSVLNVEDEDGRWVTIRGVHVFIDDEGTIKKGPNHLQGKNVKEMASLEPSSPKGLETSYQTFSGAKDADAWGSKHFSRGSLSEEKLDAIDSYQSDEGYTQINAYLRKGKAVDPTYTKWSEKIAGRMAAVIDSSSVPENITAYRGMSLVGDKAKRFQERYARLKVGQTIVDKGFLSTTLDSKVAHEFSNHDGALFEIRVPKGTKGLYMDAVVEDMNEQELLLQRGTKLKLVAKHSPTNLVFEVVR